MHRPDTDARGRAPDRDLGILPGHGRSGGRAKPWPQGGVIAFGNRPLPCALRTGSSLPMLGGRPADGADSPVGSETPRQPREARRLSKMSRGDCPFPKDNRYSLDLATLAIFPEYVEFDGEDVLKLVVQGEAGRTIK